MSWVLGYLPEAKEDLKRLDNSVRAQVYKALRKVVKNPLPTAEGGYGKPLGNKSSGNLTGLMKVKLKSAGLRVVYKLEYVDGIMKIVIISARADDEVYKEAASRRQKYGL